MTDTLKRYIYGIKLQENTNIVERDTWSMLTRSMPSNVLLDAKAGFNATMAKQNIDQDTQNQLMMQTMQARMTGNNLPQLPHDFALQNDRKMEAVKMLEGKPIPYVVEDHFANWPSFTNIMYCALDYQRLILFILVFCLFDRVTGSSIVSIFIVYIMDKVMRSFRAWLSENNISKKTLIDERFLI
jgi:hypothetical protein